MTFEISLVLALLGGAMLLFVLEKPRADVVALLLLVSLVIAGLLEPKEALSGFSSPAVVTVWAVFILSAALSRTGVAHMMGRQILRFAGPGEVRLMVLIMLVSGLLSAFMNNVGATALLLPVVMNLARQTGIAPSKLLIPLSFSALLGGMLTLIGTPPNILIAESVRERGLAELGLFDFAPVGGSVLVAGILYMALVGRHLLPSRDLSKDVPGGDLRALFGLHKRLLILEVPEDSPLAGKSLARCRIQAALGLTVIGITRGGRTRLAPGPDEVLRGGDRLLAEGRPGRLEDLQGSPSLTLGESEVTLEPVVSGSVSVASVRVTSSSKLAGKSLIEIDFRNRFGPVAMAIRRAGQLLYSGYDSLALEEGDILLLQARPEEVAALAELPDFETVSSEEAGVEELEDHFLRLGVPPGSLLAGQTLADSNLAELGILLLALSRADRGAEQTDEQTITVPSPDEILRAGDSLLVKADPEDLEIVHGLQSLRVEKRAEQSVETLESTQVGLAVAAISPNSRVARKTLLSLHFREKFGLTVLALWRQGRVLRSNLAQERLKFGDALLLHGPRDRLSLLASESDFLILSEEIQTAPNYSKAPLAIALMLGVIAVTVIGWLPIYIAAVLGAALMIVTGCLSIDDAYREIEWRAVFLIAGMLPLGLAMEKTGAAAYIADAVVGTIGGVGPLAIVAGLFVLAVVGAQVMPTAAVALLLAPIAIDTAESVGLSAMPLVMAVAVGASTSFISPVTHPANVLVMGPGGYRFGDYVKVGLPLAVLTFAVVLLVLPLFWPL